MAYVHVTFGAMGGHVHACVYHVAVIHCRDANLSR